MQSFCSFLKTVPEIFNCQRHILLPRGHWTIQCSAETWHHTILIGNHPIMILRVLYACLLYWHLLQLELDPRHLQNIIFLCQFDAYLMSIGFDLRNSKRLIVTHVRASCFCQIFVIISFYQCSTIILLLIHFVVLKAIFENPIKSLIFCHIFF